MENTLTENLIEVTRVAAILNLTENIIRKRVRAKAIPFRKLGDGPRPRIRFYESEIRAHINGAQLKPIENGVTIKRDN